MGKILKYSRKTNGDIIIEMQSHKPIILPKRDIGHYSSVAYALRTILALQQDVMFRTDIKLVTFDPETISSLKEFLDIFTMAVLKLSDRQARLLNEYALSPEIFQKAWEKV